jgi:hypothetical protein
VNIKAYPNLLSPGMSDILCSTVLGNILLTDPPPSYRDCPIFWAWDIHGFSATHSATSAIVIATLVIPASSQIEIQSSISWHPGGSMLMVGTSRTERKTKDAGSIVSGILVQ